MPEILAINQLNSLSKDSAFLEALCVQIVKDFHLAGVSISMGRIIDIESLFTEVINHVKSINNEGQLNQLLYAIDVPSSQYHQALDSDDPLHITAELIIRREAYKIVLRRKYAEYKSD